MRTTYLSGRCGQDPELKHAQNGTAYTSVSLACSEKKGETWETHWFRLVAFGFSAEYLARHARKGSKLMAVCKPETKEWTGKDGTKKKSEDYLVMEVGVVIQDEKPEQSPTGYSQQGNDDNVL